MAPHHEGDQSRAVERRRWSRVGLSVPVRLGKRSGEEGRAVAYAVGRSLDMSAGGTCIATEFGGPFTPDEILTVSIAIPWESRREFPFSLIEGTCRVVRVDQARGEVGLSFCPANTTMLGAGVLPR